MLSIAEKIQTISSDFKASADWEKKYEKIIQYGKDYLSLSESEKVDDLKIKGCQSQVWIKAELSGDRVKFKGDSDALLVKGLMALVLNIYSDERPEDILKIDPYFLKEMGLDSGLSSSRTSGVYAMIKQIKYYAAAYQYLLSTRK